MCEHASTAWPTPHRTDSYPRPHLRNGSDLRRLISRSTNRNYGHRPLRADGRCVRRREAGGGRLRNVALDGYIHALVARDLEDIALALVGALTAVVADNRAGC